MTVNVKDTGGGADFTPVPEGIHQAVCTAVVDLGAQNTTYMGQPKVTHQIWIRWEIPAHRINYTKDGNEVEGPMAIGNTYTASLSQKANLRKVLEGWRGKAFAAEELESFDVTKVLGTCCQIQVQHAHKGDKTYSNVISVVGWPAGLPRITAEGEALSYGGDDVHNLSKLPKWVQEKLGASTPASPAPAGAPRPPPTPAADFDDDIPF